MLLKTLIRKYAEINPENMYLYIEICPDVIKNKINSGNFVMNEHRMISYGSTTYSQSSIYLDMMYISIFEDPKDYEKIIYITLINTKEDKRISIDLNKADFFKSDLTILYKGKRIEIKIDDKLTAIESIYEEIRLKYEEFGITEEEMVNI